MLVISVKDVRFWLPACDCAVVGRGHGTAMKGMLPRRSSQKVHVSGAAPCL